MVGDRQQDVLASIFHGIVPIGVLWVMGLAMNSTRVGPSTSSTIRAICWS